MYTLIRVLPARRLLLEQAPSLVLAFVIAELFYKFHSFTLECGAFLVTWFVIDAAWQGLASALRGAPRQRSADG